MTIRLTARLACMVVALIALMVASTAPRAEVWFTGNRYETLDQAGEFETYFRTRARVSLGPEHRLGNGVSWRSLTDVRTGARMPRVTWMPDRTSLAVANRFLEIAHGAAIARVDEVSRIRLGNETIWRTKGGIRPPPSRRPSSEIVLSYASKRFIGYVGGRPDRDETGEGGPNSDIVMFDVETGKMSAEGHCLSRERSWLGEEAKPDHFDLGGLIPACDDTTAASFRAAVLLWARQSKARFEWLGASSRSCHQIAWELVPVTDPMLASFITHRGLAVYRGNDPVIPGPECRSYWPTGEPLIVPYGAIAAFMQPGRLRDELLASSP